VVERAHLILAVAAGQTAPAAAVALGLAPDTGRAWVKRFNAAGLDGLEDRPRSGRPVTYGPELVGEVLATALTKPDALGLPFACWTLDRSEAYLNEERGIAIKRSRIDELLGDEGLRWRTQETWFGERAAPPGGDADPSGGVSRGPPPGRPTQTEQERARQDPQFAQNRGPASPATPPRPAGRLVVCLDEMGPESAKRFPAQHLVPARDGATGRASRATPEIDDGRRGKGDLFGAFKPREGEAFTAPSPSRSAANWADFLTRVEAWLPAELERVYGIVDNRSAHRATAVLLVSLAHPRWEFVFQPTYAAYLNLIEPWWKVLRSLALKGRRFQTWEDVCQAIRDATAYWNAHRHPFVWGRRRRHRPRRRPGVARMAKVA